MTDRTASPRPQPIALIVNPIAGMGGPAALKGTDGAAVLARARAMGAQPMASAKAIRGLSRLGASAPPAQLVSVAGAMGGDAASAAGFKPDLLDHEAPAETTAEDTRAAARELLARNVGLILFAGGDGTARDI